MYAFDTGYSGLAYNIYFSYGTRVHLCLGSQGTPLAKSSSSWLVGDKCTYADLAFVTWDTVILQTMKTWVGEEGGFTLDRFPHFRKWHQQMMARPAVAKVIEMRRKETEKYIQADLEEAQRQTGRKELTNSEKVADF
ncbi:uncharacterized protein Z518_07935 [Rhinocladiella mackenziei CBS 650.93]|uniref:GST C-terminal domain-containing protein n=1 Tax=Rhinocladiella mackenziei CBS 650.93 TaxID=1442369 RepID=A0A0D2IFF4_9EURO|nr:uncharacterized protein Z518_07935 [Rhinocladiella mackenziei CBS 650.93]KIX01996.1 hypothetical protein Z518_07935 [Rhinocladiella mackenziei CBS 650.93]